MHNNLTHFRRQDRSLGFSLVELMIAVTIGLMLVAGLTTFLVMNLGSNRELQKSNRQVENGRFSIEAMREDIELAGFYGPYFPSAVTATIPDPCALVLSAMGFAAPGYRWNTGTATRVPVGIQGVTDAEASPGCVLNRKPNTDILIIRRASTEAVVIDANGDNAADANVTMEDGTTAAFGTLGARYNLQISGCPEAGEPFQFVMDKDTTQFVLHTIRSVGTPPTCTTGTRAAVRKYIVRIYYVASCNDCSGAGDGIPTLKMVELTPAASACATGVGDSCGSMDTYAVADGIEDLQLEYGVDSDSDGVANTYSVAPAAADWANVISVRMFVLARNTETTPGYTDTKQYALNSTGTPGAALGGAYRRHVYSATVLATNLAGRRN